MGFAEVDRIIADHGKSEAGLIGILMDIQKKYNYLSPENLNRVSERLEIPMTHVYSVATFYRTFSLTPRGRHLCSVCMGTACHVRGAKRILEGIERKIGTKANTTAEDLSYTLETVNCLGSCALGPLVVLDGKYHGKVTTAKMDKIIDKVNKAGEEAK